MTGRTLPIAADTCDELLGAASASGYAVIVRETLARMKISNRALQRAGVITERTRRTFYVKLDAGLLNVSEFENLYSFLSINPIRAMIAVICLRNPMAYFDPVCEVLSIYYEEISAAMLEQAAALGGDFTIIHRNLCRSHANRITREIAEQQLRTKLWLERGGE